ncbi:WecB/TagA/CpsF family glycosyltransferase [Fictibacillus barbaricus]|uniref:N-acetylglucosaminyldiphosphoundecaprenol N-acetyl-beta-D-mannosaminyltransferase n=1 Tax=Fictibacillus barbaricus TaxID=182136 RepID=A0ABU1U1H1_9BACL|nr:WecB/TagA/CpsF family glycosyltransferase [Fictibacillus barbaricus]MDR7073324.1 N-acetylglucosaminyldiphosphoundecaprenol N-acetyl-beta-D-mannosaminyltransferase [Fictibacillus barbaricus]
MGKSINLFNIKIDNYTVNQVLHYTENIIHNKIPSYYVTPNVDHIVMLDNDAQFKKIYDNAALVLADGMPLIWTSKLLRKKIVEKISGSDLTPKLIELAIEKKYKVYILGGSQTAGNKIIDLYKNNLEIDFYSPPFGFETNSNELNKIKEKLQKFNPDILLVSLGAPKGEKWIFDHYQELKIPLSIHVGAAIEFLAGTIKRAPHWMQRNGLEWFYRFLMEPKRMFKRYFIRDSKFFLLLFKELKNKQ